MVPTATVFDDYLYRVRTLGTSGTTRRSSRDTLMLSMYAQLPMPVMMRFHARRHRHCGAQNPAQRQPGAQAQQETDKAEQ